MRGIEIPSLSLRDSALQKWSRCRNGTKYRRSLVILDHGLQGTRALLVSFKSKQTRCSGYGPNLRSKLTNLNLGGYQYHRYKPPFTETTEDGSRGEEEDAPRDNELPHQDDPQRTQSRVLVNEKEIIKATSFDRRSDGIAVSR